ncbi:hypothetical protein EPR50_G00245120, partial [Perca flavescens]
MASGLLDAPAEGDALCVFLLSDSAERREVGCQSDSAERREVGCQSDSAERREVGCQSDSAERREVGCQVDLLTQQLSWTHTGSSEMLLQCFVRPDGPDGGALLQHCTNRTRTIKPGRRATPPTPPPPRPDHATQRPPKRRCRRNHRVVPDPQQEEEEQDQEVEQEVVEEDTGDPTWTPPDGDAASRPAACALEDSDSQHAPVRLDSASQHAPVQLDSASQHAPVRLDLASHHAPVQLDSASQHAPVRLDLASHHAPVRLDSASQHAPVRAAVKLEPNSIMCDVCGKVMKNKSSLARHSFIHTGKKPFACQLCELRCRPRQPAASHGRLHPDGVARRQKPRAARSRGCA